MHVQWCIYAYEYLEQGYGMYSSQEHARIKKKRVGKSGKGLLLYVQYSKIQLSYPCPYLNSAHDNRACIILVCDLGPKGRILGTYAKMS